MLWERAQERIDAMRLLLLWEGRLNRARLMALFELGEARASQWIKEFRDAHPDWVTWDSRARSQLATSVPYADYEETTPNAADRAALLARYLSLTGLPQESARPRGDGVHWAAFPELAAPDPRVFAELRWAIVEKAALCFDYVSMRDPSPHARTVSPHSLLRVGRRWHVRGHCAETNDFRDFALGRIVQISATDLPAGPLIDADEGWNTYVVLNLVAHPELSSGRAGVIQREYFHGQQQRIEHCRRCLVAYFLQDLRVATSLTAHRPPDYQLALGNLAEVQPWIFS